MTKNHPYRYKYKYHHQILTQVSVGLTTFQTVCDNMLESRTTLLG